jgi:hypothetical protein
MWKRRSSPERRRVPVTAASLFMARAKRQIRTIILLQRSNLAEI